jgi:membrane protein implicated in regulation of membrane protease activity
MDDKSLGSLIVVFSLLFITGYLVWAFGPLLPVFKLWITPELSEWAYRLPVFLAVNAMLLLVLDRVHDGNHTAPDTPRETLGDRAGGVRFCEQRRRRRGKLNFS